MTTYLALHNVLVGVRERPNPYLGRTCFSCPITTSSERLCFTNCRRRPEQGCQQGFFCLCFTAGTLCVHVGSIPYFDATLTKCLLVFPVVGSKHLVSTTPDPCHHNGLIGTIWGSSKEGRMRPCFRLRFHNCLRIYTADFGNILLAFLPNSFVNSSVLEILCRKHFRFQGIWDFVVDNHKTVEPAFDSRPACSASHARWLTSLGKSHPREIFEGTLKPRTNEDRTLLLIKQLASA